MNAPFAPTRANTLDAHWMGFTANKAFKANPRLFASAKGMFYTTVDGREVLDGTAGLWCVNAGHGREEIVEAIRRQAGELDYAPTFNLGHPLAFEMASAVAAIFPAGMDRVFFCNSGSEAVESALKIAIAYQRSIGEGTRTRLIGRERGYHGVGFGGISVGGMVANRRVYPQLPGVDHLRSTHVLPNGAFVRGQRDHGAELADDLERMVALHGAETIAAVIVEPVSGSTGVLIPPKGYLERLREIATKHGILLIFDEVITGFGRLGAATAAQYFGVTPDLIACAKGLTNAAVPMGAVVAGRHVYDAIVEQGPAGIELFHGYTYGGHPLACAAGLAAQGIYQREGLFERARAMSAAFEDAVHSLKGTKNLIDIRNLGLVAAFEFAPRDGAAPGARGMDAFAKLYEAGLLARAAGDVICLSPPLILEDAHIERIVNTLGEVFAGLE